MVVTPAFDEVGMPKTRMRNVFRKGECDIGFKKLSERLLYRG